MFIQLPWTFRKSCGVPSSDVAFFKYLANWSYLGATPVGTTSLWTLPRGFTGFVSPWGYSSLFSLKDRDLSQADVSSNITQANEFYSLFWQDVDSTQTKAWCPVYTVDFLRISQGGNPACPDFMEFFTPVYLNQSEIDGAYNLNVSGGSSTNPWSYRYYPKSDKPDFLLYLKIGKMSYFSTPTPHATFRIMRAYYGSWDIDEGLRRYSSETSPYDYYKSENIPICDQVLAKWASTGFRTCSTAMSAQYGTATGWELYFDGIGSPPNGLNSQNIMVDLGYFRTVPIIGTYSGAGPRVCGSDVNNPSHDSVLVHHEVYGTQFNVMLTYA